jgi:hypothetical protein
MIQELRHKNPTAVGPHQDGLLSDQKLDHGRCTIGAGGRQGANNPENCCQPAGAASTEPSRQHNSAQHQEQYASVIQGGKELGADQRTRNGEDQIKDQIVAKPK